MLRQKWFKAKKLSQLLKRSDLMRGFYIEQKPTNEALRREATFSILIIFFLFKCFAFDASRVYR